jgi:hypothetical protein
MQSDPSQFLPVQPRTGELLLDARVHVLPSDVDDDTGLHPIGRQAASTRSQYASTVFFHAARSVQRAR